jgi:hypothetical protein
MYGEVQTSTSLLYSQKAPKANYVIIAIQQNQKQTPLGESHKKSFLRVKNAAEFWKQHANNNLMAVEYNL